MPSKLIHAEITEKILKCFFIVYNNLGFGYLEKVYESALKLELEEIGLRVEIQKPIHVIYKGKIIGNYFADMLVENCVVVEIKSVTGLNSDHEAQLINYLATTNSQVGLLLNFGPKPQFMRKVHTPNKLHDAN